MNKPKKWYDDWNVTIHPNGTYEVSLPHSLGEKQSLAIEPPYTKEDIDWVCVTLMCALEDLTRRDEEIRSWEHDK